MSHDETNNNHNNSSIFIIEHLESNPSLSRWCLIEYERISRIAGRLAGKDNLWFTNISSKSDRSKLLKLGRVFKDSVKLMSNINLKYACVLDPQADTLLAPKDKEKFRYFIFGGILGDYPPKKRTNKELTRYLKNADIRNIGKKQFSTDNAVWIVNEIINNGKNFDEIKFKDKLEIKINDVESVILPYYYPLGDKGNPLISSKIIGLLERKKKF